MKLTEFDTGRICGLREIGMSFRDIAERGHRSICTVVNYCHAYFSETPDYQAEGIDGRLRLLALRDGFNSLVAVAN